MAGVTAPLLSFGASGAIAKTQVYSTWRGKPYVRRHVVPSNPNTAGQQLTRNTFAWLQSVYKIAPSLFTAPWEAYIAGKPLTSRNAFTKFNNGVLREETDLALFNFSPGALGGLPPASVVIDNEAGNLEVNVTVPTVIPTGWTLVRAIAASIADQDPQSDADYTIVAGSDATDPYEINLAGTAAVLYRVGTWLEWLRPDGKTAYSPSVLGSGTPS